jgi:hypothetical protein
MALSYGRFMAARTTAVVSAAAARAFSAPAARIRSSSARADGLEGGVQNFDQLALVLHAAADALAVLVP